MTDREERARRSILAAAAAVLSKDSGASLAEIATAAGVGRTTVHRYFPTRTALVFALADEALAEVDRALTDSDLTKGTAPEVLRRVADRLIVLADKFMFLEVSHQVWQGGISDRWYALVARLETVVNKGKSEGSIRGDLPTAWVVDLYAAAVIAAGEAVADGRLARQDAPGLVIDTILHGIEV